MTTTMITIPESLTNEKTRLEKLLTEIITKEAELAKQRGEITSSLDRIAGAVAVLSGQPLPKSTTSAARRPMSDEARKKIGDALRKRAADKKAQATEKRDEAAGLRTAATVVPEAAGKLNTEAVRLENWADKIDGKSAAAGEKPEPTTAKPAPATKPADSKPVTTPAAKSAARRVS